MPRTLVIAEAGSTWECDLEKAYRLIRAAKDAGSDAVKFQFTSNPEKMAARRGLPDAAPMYRKYLAWPQGYIPELKAKCDEVGIQLGITAYLLEDIGCVAPFVDFFKVSAFESGWDDFIDRHFDYKGRPLIVSTNPGCDLHWTRSRRSGLTLLHCISKYPTPLDELNMSRIREENLRGFSDHTGMHYMGSLAVAFGSEVIETHIRLYDTPKDNPDFSHSLICEGQPYPEYKGYVENIRLVEKMR